MSETNLCNYNQDLFERVCLLEELQLAFKAVRSNRGVSPRMAGAVVYSNRKSWALSTTMAASKAYSNHWFIDTLGQKIVSNRKISHWFELNKCIKFT
jgi:hypothetical protein